MKGETDITVLSLFDGISGMQMALERSGHRIGKYYASELSPYPIKVTQRAYPNTIQLGDIYKVRGDQLGHIDILAGGFSCKSFSSAGKRMYFDDANGKLFYEMVRILGEVRKVNPNVTFLFENVPMKKAIEQEINRIIGVNPIEIDGNLVSAQNRRRLWWTNINERATGLFGHSQPHIPQPKDKKIYLADVLESEVDEKYFLKGKRLALMISKLGKYTKINGLKCMCICAGMDKSWQGTFLICDVKGKLKNNQLKASCFTSAGSDHSDADFIGMVKFGRTPEGKAIRRANMARGKDYSPFSEREIIGVDTHKSNCITSSMTSDTIITDGIYFRRMTPIEVERLFTVPENYTDNLSDSRRYEVLGNGWVIDVAAHILSFWKY